MKNLLFGFVVLVSAGLCLAGCSSDDSEDNMEAVSIDSMLCHKWILVGYGNDQDFHIDDGDDDGYIGFNASVTFHTDGTFDSYVEPNEGYGEYKCKGNQILFVSYTHTQGESANPIYGFIGDHLFQQNVNQTYQLISDTELRIYYEGDHYFKFYRKD
jgi:hypothetical protein